MILQHAWIKITDIPGYAFPEVSLWIQTYPQNNIQSIENLCRQFQCDPFYVRRWNELTEYQEADGCICNCCTVYAHPLVFQSLLRTMLTDLAAAFPGISFRGSFRLMHSNWGFSIYPFQAAQGALIWGDETLARQQPEIRKFWDAMQKASYVTIRDLLESMYAPMTGPERNRAFSVLDDLFFDPSQEVSSVDGCYFDDEGYPEPDSMVEYTYTCFLNHCWSDYGDIWMFFKDLQEQFSRKQVPFCFPADFLASIEN